MPAVDEWQSTADHATSDDWQSTTDHVKSPTPSEPKDDESFLGNAAEHANPLRLAKGAWDTVTHPLNALQSWRDSSQKLHDDAVAAAERGDYHEAIDHGISFLANIIPGLGKSADEYLTAARDRDKDPSEENQKKVSAALGSLVGDTVAAREAAAAPKLLKAAGSPEVGAAASKGVAIAKGAVEGAKEGAISTTEIPSHGIAARALKAVGVDKVPVVPVAAVAGKYAAHAIFGPDASLAGEVVGAAAPVVRGAVRGGMKAARDFDAAQRVGDASRVPVWDGVGDPPESEPQPEVVTPEIKATAEKIAADKKAAADASKKVPVARNPAWDAEQPAGGAPDPEPPPPPIDSPKLPSGRTPGSFEKAQAAKAEEPVVDAAQEPTTEKLAVPATPASAPATPAPTGLLDDIAKSLGYKSYAQVVKDKPPYMAKAIQNIAEKSKANTVAPAAKESPSSVPPPTASAPDSIPRATQGEAFGDPDLVKEADLPVREGHEKVASSNVHSFKYDPQSKELEVVFKSGQMYRYPDVPKNVADGLKNADSAGAFIRQHVRPKFKGIKDSDGAPLYKAGDTVHLKGIGAVKITKVNPDGTFEY